ncbi:hypothetical protein H4S02_010881 [Coemansia sp. RSA 2611]|nr:hypothetical protein H4S02_010881 [Coemansia sp. RSA 2611]
MRPTTGGLRLRDRLYQSKATLHLEDLIFSLSISPSTTVEPPACIERCGNLIASQSLAGEVTGDGDADGPHAELFPNSSSAEAMTPASEALAIAAGTDGLDDEDQKQRRKVRRLRTRYERWFGPYVTVPYGGGNSNGGESAETHSADA